tara:strand:- start:524 stop:1216 length:693 start_codon:yes stop_codon:yes gene_type:complete
MQINTALILCAGFGKRLLPLTQSTPKPLLKIGQITLLERTIKLIEKLQIKKIKINTFYLSKEIKKFVDQSNTNLDIQLIEDGNEILDTGGGIFNMIKDSSEENFLVFNPDTLWNENYDKNISKMVDLYFRKQINNILLVVPKDLSFDKRLKGDFNLINEKLTKDNNKNFIYTGCQIINKNIFSKITKKKFSMNEIWNSQLKESRLFAYESNIEFLHVTDLEIYNKILKNQ